MGRVRTRRHDANVVKVRCLQHLEENLPVIMETKGDALLKQCSHIVKKFISKYIFKTMFVDVYDSYCLRVLPLPLVTIL
jgi:hypothetical protein